MADTYFHNKTILITGAGSGIGKATAHKLHTLGATLILCDINQTFLDELQQELSSSTPASHQYIQLDVSSSIACSEAIEHITSSSSSASPIYTLSGLFNCAGINPTYTSIATTTDTYLDRLINVNLRGPYYMTRACMQKDLLRRGSAIVNVSSTCGLRGYAGYSVYCATKFGIIGLTKSLALELGPQGIRVNAVAPGPIDTPTMAGNVAGGAALDEWTREVGLRRLGRPEEVADVVAYLFGGESTFVTGGVIEVHGGLK